MEEEEDYEYHDEEENEGYDEYIDVPECSELTILASKNQTSMIFLKLEDIRSIINTKVDELRELIGENFDKTLILFHYFKWSKDKLENSDWFTDKDHIQNLAGLIPDTIEENDPIISSICRVCFCEEDSKNLDSLECGHKICKSCWYSYINDKVSCKENDFFWKCPGHTKTKNCNLIIPDSFNKVYLDKENEIKYIKKLCMSYAQENKAIKWCPAPDCCYAVENASLFTRGIRCKCSFVFCFTCGKEDHSPCDCAMVSEWENKNTKESKNTEWINLYTKDCPKCKRAIEKQQGCNHMICKHKGCDYEFCWLCLDEWSVHQGGHYKCNRYESGSVDEKKKMSKSYDEQKSQLQKYVFYYERFCNNDQSCLNAQILMKKIESSIKEFHTKLALPYAEVTFLLEASEILCRSRRILKWTYCYSFYLANEKKKELFEFHQKDLEKYLEGLHELLEIKLHSAVRDKYGVLDIKSFISYKNELIASFTKVEKFSNELIRTVESGL